MKKFDTYEEACNWAEEQDRSLELLGTCTGDERILKETTVGDYHIAIWKRVAEAVGIGERNEIVVNINEYIVVTTNNDKTFTSPHISIADDYDDAERIYGYEVMYSMPQDSLNA